MSAWNRKRGSVTRDRVMCWERSLGHINTVQLSMAAIGQTHCRKLERNVLAVEAGDGIGHWHGERTERYKECLGFGLPRDFLIDPHFICQIISSILTFKEQ